MKVINEQLDCIIRKFNITRTHNILYGTNIPMPNAVIPTPWKVYVRFNESQYFFFYFDEEGIKVFPVSGEGYFDIPWGEIIDFKMRHVSILGEMVIKTELDTYKFQINRFVIGCPWIKANRKHLESVNYYYKD